MSETPCIPLGKPTTYIDKLAPTLLFAVPRAEKRNELGINVGEAPFFGEDIWNAYELSWLNSKGKPELALAAFRFPCTSPMLIESKSFKLYLNSFNQTQFLSAEKVQQQLILDLSAACGTKATIVLQPVSSIVAQQTTVFEGEVIDQLDIAVSDYVYAPWLLQNSCTEEVVTEILVSHLLKSNCLVTGQPDWGSIQISYSGKKIQREALLKYLISFRQHHEFHEHCVERIYMDLQKYCQPQKLTVYARYTRRGGLDINPWRSSQLVDMENVRLLRQ